MNLTITQYSFEFTTSPFAFEFTPGVWFFLRLGKCVRCWSEGEGWLKD